MRRVEGTVTNHLEEPATESRIPVSRALTATPAKGHRGALPVEACQDRLKTSPAGNRCDICLSEYSDPRSDRGAASAHAGHAAAPVELKETYDVQPQRNQYPRNTDMRPRPPTGVI